MTTKRWYTILRGRRLYHECASFGTQVICACAGPLTDVTTNEVFTTSQEVTCKDCARPPTSEGHDPCLANLPNVRAACCGHGISGAYCAYADGVTLYWERNDIGLWQEYTDVISALRVALQREGYDVSEMKFTPPQDKVIKTYA